ncbi:uncharacterized protein [Drosophila pseudoobscura]|uniref:Uncharacterized protein n=1 Tax=Drosophila pseudoobscura pseudoobscura TaxID=46245 RepID=A0A6I8WA78_DROPS|nr:uncharacterized protein LOC6901674 [Drosophila pseudoobscura]XP_015041981.2 uncharacterized protein LOC6901674 [Drosophila pseudoobscura]XP_033240292.1 uncharacterized protein LOC6901674 [Drosophila pseudoobscura]XP_033240293.1 uncharacterized protein LOC6901674 [Drosophila pseudoobscura]
MDEDSSSSSGSDKPKTHSKSTSTEDSLGVSTTSSTWTILPSDRIEMVLDNPNRNEEAKVPGESQCGDSDEKHENDRCNLAVVEDSQADDISDGISIISDCESTDRISPHPFLRDTLADLNFNELPNTPLRLSPRNIEGLPLTPPPPPPLRQRRHKHTETEPYVQPELNLLQQETKLETLYRMYPVMQNSLTAVFYVGATLAILGFIGKLQHPEWPGFGSDKPIAELERRLGELEMSNNLMRAEIDIMSKQLQYLSSGQGPAYAPDGYYNAYAQEQGGMENRQGKKYKKFKAWPGLGDSLEPLDITKEDLKKPHKCRDGQYVKFAAMCLESPLPAPESLVDEIGDAVHDVLQQSQAFRNFEKVTEKLGTLGTDGAEDEGDATGTNEAKAFHPDGRQQATGNGNGNPHKQPKPKVDRYNDKYSPNASKDRYNDKYNPNHSHEGKRDNGRGRSKEDHSKEYNNKRRHNDDPSRREREREREERFNKNGKKQRHTSGERDESDGDGDGSGSGEWHGKLMQHREQSRHRHDQKRKDNKNWYIERGDGREQARSTEAGR